ncbi:MAG: hypothetical protein U9O24_07225 [Campylobacterota bacterium]|nr:hypothetical protein [Campylobacterota bacterium]
MMKIFLLLLLSSVWVFATDKIAIPPYVALGGLLSVIALFFWGVYKAVQRQKTIYTLAMLPFIILLIGMFFI